MGFFSSIGSAFSDVGKGIVTAGKKVGETVTKIPIVGDVVKTGYGLAKGTVGAVGAVGKNLLGGAVATSGVVGKGVPKILSGAVGDVTSVEKGVQKAAPLILHDVTQVAGSVAKGVGGIANVAEYLPFLAVGAFGLYVMNNNNRERRR